MTYAPEVIEALAQLRYSAATHSNLPANVKWAINTLDNADVFAALDEQTDYASAEAILAESALASVSNAADPAEWGDTTSADMARHQGVAGDQPEDELGFPLGEAAVSRLGDPRLGDADGHNHW